MVCNVCFSYVKKKQKSWLTGVFIGSVVVEKTIFCLHYGCKAGKRCLFREYMHTQVKYAIGDYQGVLEFFAGVIKTFGRGRSYV